VISFHLRPLYAHPVLPLTPFKFRSLSFSLGHYPSFIPSFQIATEIEIALLYFPSIIPISHTFINYTSRHSQGNRISTFLLKKMNSPNNLYPWVS